MNPIKTAVLILLVGHAPLAAQQTAADFHDFYAALPGMQEAELVKAAGSPQAGESGLAALQLHRRTENPDYATEAGAMFAAAVKADRDDPWAHFGLGLTLTRARKTMAIIRASGA